MSGDPEADADIAHSYGFTEEEAARYTLWRPPGPNMAATIVQTDDDGRTWRVHVHNDKLGDAFAAFLERHGAPSFSTVQERSRYLKELEQNLCSGLQLKAARNTALESMEDHSKKKLTDIR